jgi:hypothetical protein
LATNHTVETLDVWIPEYNDHTIETTTEDEPICNQNFTPTDIYSLVSFMISTNKTIHRLTILPTINVFRWEAIFTRLMSKYYYTTSQYIDNSLPSVCSAFLSSATSITSLTIIGYWMMSADTTANEGRLSVFYCFATSCIQLEINNFESEHIGIALEAIHGHQCIRKLETFI